MTLDHLVAKKNGGGRGRNLVPACESCNVRKGHATNGYERMQPWARQIFDRVQVGTLRIGEVEIDEDR